MSDSSVEMREGVVYGKGGGRDLVLDLFLPVNCRDRKPMPAMIFMHGGGWTGGNRGQFHWQSRRLAAEGIASACITYRFSQEAIYPAAVEDAKCAVRWMRANARDLNVNADRIGAGGGSAGGHLAAMLATTAHLPALEGRGGHADCSSRIGCAVLFNPAVDMAGLLNPAALEVTVRFMGGTSEQRPELYREASPLFHVSKDTAPCLLFHGVADVIVPHGQSARFEKALRSFGVEVELVSVEGKGHGFFNASPFLESTCAKMESWLKRRWGL